MTRYAGDKLEGSAKIEEAIRGEALIYIRKQINKYSDLIFSSNYCVRSDGPQ
jgi:hypothetical protein